MVPPAILIFPINPNTSSGWRNESCDMADACQDKTGQNFINCLDHCSYSAEDFIISTSTSGNDNYTLFSNSSSSDWYTWRYFNTFDDGFVQYLEMDDNAITNDIFSTASFVFNNELSYQIYIMDQRLTFITGSPEIIPRIALSWNKKAKGGASMLYMKVIRHEKLNRPNKPCESSPEYDFEICLDRSLITNAGCEPPWGGWRVMESVPTCDNLTLLLSYDEEYWKFFTSDEKRLFEVSKCLMPCSFMEYKVSLHKMANLFLYMMTFFLTRFR